MKFIKECPILIGIVTIAVILTAVSFACRDYAYGDYADDTDPLKVPALALVLKGARDGVYPWNPGGSGDGAEADGGLMAEDGSGDGQADGELSDGAEGAADQAQGADANGDASGQEALEDGPSWLYGEVDEAAGQAEEAQEEEQEEVYEFTQVDDDYFTDALFIGDSRTVGLSEYCEPLDSRATFYSKVSLTIFTVMNKEFIKTDTGKISVDTALQNNQFAKIYIMLGLNEIGTGDTQYFKDAYEEVINRIVELQPDAIIYIQGIMHVTEKKGSGDKNFNNDKINTRNAAIAELADDKRIFYIDMNEAVDDENGNLDSSLSFDGVHLKASSYERWYDFLLHNAIVR